MKTSRKSKKRSRATKKRTIKANRPLHKKILLHPAAYFILLCLGVILITSSVATHAANVTISAIIPATPLDSAATLTSPTNNANETASPITVNGSCPQDSYVTLFRNNLSSGSAFCQPTSTFSIETDLSPGNNSLKVQDYNVENVAGPASTVITVNYNPPRAVASTPGQLVPAANTPVNNGLFITEQYLYRTFTTSSNYEWQMNLSGGQPPYVVTVQWGDGTSSNLFFNSDPVFEIQHHYSQSGIFNIVISCIDASGNKVVTQISSIIKTPGSNTIGLTQLNGANPSNPIVNQVGVLKSDGKLLWVIWPTYVIVLLMTISFWLGEKRELQTVMNRTRPRRH